MASTKKLESNRRNSKLSTGPNKTDRTRLNATNHGILSGGGVIDEVDGEDARELFEDLKAKMWHGMAPKGFVEEDVVYQMVETKWRRRRLRNWETNLIQVQVSDVKDRWENPSKTRRLPESVTARVMASTAHLGAYELYKETAGEFEDIIGWLVSGVPLSKLPISYVLIQYAEKELKVDVQDILGPGSHMADDSLLKTEYDSEQVQLVIDASCKTLGFNEIDLRAKFEGFLTKALNDFRAEEKRQLRSYNQGILLASVPDDTNFAKMVRYDALLFNQYQKLFHELQRLQAARLGADLPLPIAVDVNLGI